MAEKKEKFNIASLLNTKSRGTAQAEELAQETGSAFGVAMLDVDDLIPCNGNFYSTDNIDELAAAIELSGCIEQNLVVKPEVHGKYEIIAGHRRRLAVLKLIGEGKEEYKSTMPYQERIRRNKRPFKPYLYQCNGKAAYRLGKSKAGRGIKRSTDRVQKGFTGRKQG